MSLYQISKLAVLSVTLAIALKYYVRYLNWKADNELKLSAFLECAEACPFDKECLSILDKGNEK